MKRKQGIVAALAAGTVALAGAPAAHAWESDCANQDRAVTELSTSKAEKAIVCVFTAYRRSNGDPRVVVNSRVRKAAQRSLKAKSFSIKSIVKRLSAAGYFSHGGKGFSRCSPLKITSATTAEEAARLIIKYEGFVLAPPHRDVGVAIRGKRIFVIVGRRK